MAAVKESYPVIGMTCASCVKKIETILQKTEGISYAAANLASEKITVEFDDSMIDRQKIAKIMKGMGYELIVE